jgi:hypothetical protein
MMSKNFDRATERFIVYGIDLNRPADLTKPGFFPLLRNIRSFTEGRLESRPGYTVITQASTELKGPVHTIRQLANPEANTYHFLVGVGNTINLISSSYAVSKANIFPTSGKPLSMVTANPQASNTPWMYVGDRPLTEIPMLKVVAGNTQSIPPGRAHYIGVLPHHHAPRVTLGEIREMLFASTINVGTGLYDWVKDGVVFQIAPQLYDRIAPTVTTTTRAVFDEPGTTHGWCSLVMPDNFITETGIGHTFALIAPGPTMTQLVVHDVLPGKSATTIAGITYDTGTSGWCTIHPTHPVTDLKQGAVILINGSVYALVDAVIPGVGDKFAIRSHTASTVSAGHTVAVQPCVRVYSPVNLTASGGDSLWAPDNYALRGLTNIAGTPEKTGWLQTTYPTPVDLTRFPTTNEATAENDYMHMSVRVSDMTKLVQGRIMLDCDTKSLGITSSTNAAPIWITTTTNHELKPGDTVFISGHTINTAANGTWLVDLIISDNVFTLKGSTGSGVGGATGTVQPQFKRNFYYRTFTANELVAASRALQTARDGRASQIQVQQLTPPTDLPASVTQRRIPDPSWRETYLPGGRVIAGGGNRLINIIEPGGAPYNPELFPPRTGTAEPAPDVSTGTADNQWSELIFRRGELVPVGPLAESRKFDAIRAVRVEFTFTDTTKLNVYLDSFSMYGGFDPDVSDLGIPYQYRVRMRVSSTGARSNWTPASHQLVRPKRCKVNVKVLQFEGGGVDIDTMDVQRLGGINTVWLDVGYHPALSIADTVSDFFALGAAPYSEDDSNYVPWARRLPPITATASSVVGNAVTTTVPVPKLAKGTPIRINSMELTYRGANYYNQYMFFVEEAVGVLTDAPVLIQEPVVHGAASQSLWAYNGRLFGCVDGTLYYGVRHNPDAHLEQNYLEVTSGAEVLVGGCSYNGKNYCWSTERMFELQEFGDVIVPLEVPGGKGMIAPWTLAVGERMWFVSRDGIYQSGGGDCVSITDDTVKLLFTRGGGPGVATMGFDPVDYSRPDKMNLSYYNGHLYFQYQDTAGRNLGMVYTAKAEQPGWWPDSYAPDVADQTVNGIACVYGAEGLGQNQLYIGTRSTIGAHFGTMTSTSILDITTTGGSPVQLFCERRAHTRSFDAGDRRADKLFGDFVVDALGVSEVALYKDNNTVLVTPTTPAYTSSSTGRTQTVFSISSGLGVQARNIAARFRLDAGSELYLWEPSFIALPEESDWRATYWDDDGYDGPKFFQGAIITADTDNIARDFYVEYDGGNGTGQLGAQITIQHDGNHQRAYSFQNPFIAHQVRIRPVAANASGGVKNFSIRWVWEKEPPLGRYWETQQTAHGYNGYVHMKAMYVTLMSTVDVTATIYPDDQTPYTYTIPTTSGTRRRVYLPVHAIKGKAFRYRFAATAPFRLYKENTDVLVKPWGSNEHFASRTPFGGEHGDGGAKI